jgi:2TM domain-containing protein
VSKPSYSSDDVQAILGRALERQQARGEGELTYEDLVAIGRDVGLGEAAIAAAAREHEREGDVDAELARRLRRARTGLLSHTASFAIVNAFLVLVNLLTGGPMWWVWPFAGWGVGLAFHLLAIATADREKVRERARAALERRRREGERRREKAARREQKERARAEREARRQALEHNAHRLKRVVEERLSEVVADLADRLEGSGQAPPDRRGEGGPPERRARVADAPTRARVEPARGDPWGDEYDEADEAELGRRSRR